MDWPCFETRMTFLHGIFESSWQMMVAMLHTNGQVKTERDGDTDKECQKPTIHQKATELN